MNFNYSTTMTRLSLFGIVALSFVIFDNVESRLGIGAGKQEWDYVEVRSGAHMFWWLYLTTDEKVSSDLEKPLIIFLEGGPGTSSTGYSNFLKKIGPYDEYLNPQNYSWVKNYNVLFIDSPVGTGFSYLDEGVSYSRTNAEVARDLLECMRGFYEKLPEFRRVPVYIMSVSYGGKMAAEFALLWYKTQKSGSFESDLRGIGLGDSWISPIDHAQSIAPYLYNTGMIDDDGYNRITILANRTRQFVDQGQWSAASGTFGIMSGEIVVSTEDVDPHNILTRKRPLTSRDQTMSVLGRLMNGEVRRALNLSHEWILLNEEVYSALEDDLMIPVTSIVEKLLDDTPLKVFVFNGQLDMITCIPGTLRWINNLKSEHAVRWKKEPRIPLIIDNIIEGFKKGSMKFSFYWIQRAGHFVTADNPAAAAAILHDLTLGYNNSLFN